MTSSSRGWLAERWHEARVTPWSIGRIRVAFAHASSGAGIGPRASVEASPGESSQVGLVFLAVLVGLSATWTALDDGRDDRGGVARPFGVVHRVEVSAHLVDIDRADVAELALLPEIGPGLAARIVADRAVRGAFGSIDALARVEGIGPARLEALRHAAIASGAER